MMKRLGCDGMVACIVGIVLLFCAAVVHAEPFLWLPFSRDYTVYISCRWTCLRDDGTTYYHNATDYGRTGDTTPVYAAADGDVFELRDDIPAHKNPRGGAYGNFVKILHPNGYETWYAHFLPGTTPVVRGQHVRVGELLGITDDTGSSDGNHLHFEVRNAAGVQVNPYGSPPEYNGDGCGPNALWAVCPPTPYPAQTVDADGDGYTPAAGDCNDADASVHPGQSERRCDGRDENCDGTPDDEWRRGLGLVPDLGSACTAGTVGACARTGTIVCTADGFGVECSASPGSPVAESCNNLDDDCNGITDDPWHTGLAIDIGEPCSIEWPLPCTDTTPSGSPSGDGGGETITTTGHWMCTPDGLAVVCDAPHPPPTGETCPVGDDDATDDVAPDDDLATDDDTGDDDVVIAGDDDTPADDIDGDGFTVEEGDCNNSDPAIHPDQSETLCDTVDENCDGVVDDPWHLGLATDLNRPCAVSTGECRATGSYVCNAAKTATTCSATPGTAVDERCDGKDNDCDGSTDEPWTTGDTALGVSCEVGTGSCLRTGAYTCTPDGTGTHCGATAGTEAEEQCDGEDNDCDGTIDTITEPCYTGPPDTDGTSTCAAGTKTCTDGFWGDCEGESLPQPEQCGDTTDSDCDGSPNGITSVLTFEHDCEATLAAAAVLSTDVSFVCIPTPNDTVIPSRTPQGTQSPYMEMVQDAGTGDAEALFEWRWTPCATSSSASVAFHLIAQTPAQAIVSIRPLITGNTDPNRHSFSIVHRDPRWEGWVNVDRELGGEPVTPVPYHAPAFLAKDQWITLGWQYDGTSITITKNGSPQTLRNVETETTTTSFPFTGTIEGIRLYISTMSAAGYTVSVAFDDVSFSSP